MKRIWLSLYIVIALLGVLAAGRASYAGLRLTIKADHVVIDKQKRVLSLLYRGSVLREYNIALGFNPVGHKQYEGDGRTPEGRYVIDWKNPQSDFYLSLKISYPNKKDLTRARLRGDKPGSMIMIHGLPNDRTAFDVGHPTRDWTNGCIAVNDREIMEIWEMVDEGTAVTIFP
jgi:murein L,D-transpeptidase YafK